MAQNNDNRKSNYQGNAKFKDSILDLAKHVEKEVKVKFLGGREVVGILKGYDQLVNMVLDNATEHFPNDTSRKSRKLGLTVCRGTSVMLVSPMEGMEKIENPFV